jgi:hypothetical protein
VRRISSLVVVCSMVAAIASVAVPGRAAAFSSEVNFDLTVYGPPPSAETLQLFIRTTLAEGGQDLLFCAPNVPQSPGGATILACLGDGQTYSITLTSPSGTKGVYRFERVSASGAITVLKEGSFVAPLVETQQLTIDATYNAGTLPNAAVAPRAPGSRAVLPTLGILMVLVATMLGGSAARRRHVRLPGTDGHACSALIDDRTKA